MVSPMRTFVEELIAKVKGKDTAPAASESSYPDHVTNLSLVKVECVDMFSAFCNFAAVLIAKLKRKVPFNLASSNITLGPFIVSFPYKKVFLILSLKFNIRLMLNKLL